jgi:hypothetical protein
MHLKMVWYSETTTWVRSQVGFGEDDAGTPYFIIRNSWSADWGEGGYVRVKAGGDPTATAVCALTTAGTSLCPATFFCAL